jgi:peptidoglycan/xylan/chitin deacetylase (PgdA/CDA1 family)
VFVVSGWLGQSVPHAPSSRVLTADEVRELHGHGVEIGGHSVSHPDLSTLEPEQAVRELRQSRETLEEILGEPIVSAAYPYGRTNTQTLRAAEEAGYRAAGRVHGEGSWDEPFNLPRQDMNNWSSLRGLRLKRDDRYAPLMRHALPRIVRRAAIVGKGIVRR